MKKKNQFINFEEECENDLDKELCKGGCSLKIFL